MMKRILTRLRREGPSWLAHAAIASAFTVAFDPFLGDWQSWRLAVWGYTFREGAQLIRKWMREWRGAKWVKVGSSSQAANLSLRLRVTLLRWRDDTNWLGAAGDVLAPALVAALVTLRWLV